ncbi:hypothetical protein [Spirosoma fluviale]|uniref:Lipocalin-like domain-containing protein n=1 Tax=Spirosoma fluviale TaxID=1597977 RepID=A0A286G9Q4_9BACT|nr:hypothetical protein [Spirosoma fluviale]SOD91849.1 hypothetical protein SAMN06269250_3671 [Spirosoma fluviale]
MKIKTLLFVLSFLPACLSCNSPQTPPSLVGTWELVSATATEKDSTFSTFDPSHKMIKLINATHFAFLNHAVSKNDSSATRFSAGGGKYTLVDSVYTENLEYFTDKAWENNKFQFVVKFAGDTLIQKGVEKVEKLGIDHIIIEKYKRVNE